jgi:hypothetical protein
MVNCVTKLISRSTAGTSAAPCRYPDSSPGPPSPGGLCYHHLHADSGRSSLRYCRTDRFHKPTGEQHRGSQRPGGLARSSLRRRDKHCVTR